MVRTLLNRKAKAWWYHRQLREYGNIAEARRGEHRSLRDTVRTLRDGLRNGGFITIGRGGWSFHYAEGCTLSGYGGDEDDETIQAAIALGIPVCDSRTVPDERICETVGFPMPGLSRSGDNFPRMFQTVPYAEYFAMAEAIGARVLNLGKSNAAR